MKITEAKKILEVVHTHKNIDLDSETVDRIKVARRAFFKHYQENPQSFIEDFIIILHGKTNEEVPFRLNPAQVSMVKEMKENRFVACPKARQLGITTLTNALALHHSLFIKNANVICMAIKTDNASENLRRIKAMFKSMPEWVQKVVMEWDEGKGHQNNVGLWSFKSRLTNSNNKLEVASASSEDGTRGKTPTFLHWTETAFSEIAEQIFTSVFPALNRRSKSQIVLESTGNGNTGFYYEVCTGERDGFGVVFMPWFLDADYRVEGEKLTEEEMVEIKDRMGVDIPEHLDEAQLRWYLQTSKTVGKMKCQQEYPVNVDQVFLSTSLSFFSHKATQSVTVKETVYTLDYSNGFLSKVLHGPGLVWETPKSTSEYLISADVSEGVIDYTSINVFDPAGEEVAYWHGKYSPDDVCDILFHLGRHFNNAWIAVESNGIGAYVLNYLRTKHFYQWIHQFDGKPGVRTTVTSKPEMLSTLQSQIISGALRFHNEVLPKEMVTFQADTLKATKGTNIHDDSVMSAAIGAYVFDQRPPKYKIIRDSFKDYTSMIDKSRPRRQFIL